MMDEHTFCLNATYAQRIDDPERFNWCAVPEGGADALLFLGVAVFVSCAVYSKLSAVWVLIAGAAFEVAAFNFNLGHFSNAATLWLGMKPSAIFFFIFLPPLLLDSAVRIDFFLFKKMAAHIISFAFFNVIVSALAMLPILMYGVGLAAEGWRSIDVALFAAMLAATDALAVTAILKSGGAPEMLSVLLEGESLFNDASSIVLFEIFLRLALAPGDVPLASQASHILREIAWLAGSGTAMGILFGILTQWLLHWFQWRGLPPHVEVAASVGSAYLTYLLTEFYVHGSGVIGVVVLGLYGAATFQFGLSAKAKRERVFVEFWDVASFVANGLVFFFVGASIVNFFVRVADELFPEHGLLGAGQLLLVKLPVILAASFGLRGLLMWVEAPLLSLYGPMMSWQEIAFSTVGGLRGGLALILCQAVLSTQSPDDSPQTRIVRAEMVLWTAGFVLFSLLVNAPLLGPLMQALHLNAPTPSQRFMKRRARQLLRTFTARALVALRGAEDEMLRGVDWADVAASVDLSKQAASALRTASSMDALSRAKHGRASERAAATARRAAGAEAGSGAASAAAEWGAGAAASRQPLLASVPTDLSSDSDWEEGSFGEREQTGDVEAGVQRAPPSGEEGLFIATRVRAQDAALAERLGGTPTEGALFSNAGDAPLAERLPATLDELALVDGASDDGAPSSPPPPPQQQQHGLPKGQAGEESRQPHPHPHHRHHWALGPVVLCTVQHQQEQAARAPTTLASNGGGIGVVGASGRGFFVEALRMNSVRPMSFNYKWRRGDGAEDGPPLLRRPSSGLLSVHSGGGGASGSGSGAQWGGGGAAALGGGDLAASRSGLGDGGGAGAGGSGGGGGGGGRGGVGGALQRQQQQQQQQRGEHQGFGVGDEEDEPFSARQGEGEDVSDEAFLEECRIRLLTGFKRYFRHKAVEGLLSAQGLRDLDWACNACLAYPSQPIDLWNKVERVVQQRGTTQALARLHYALSRAQQDIRSARRAGALDRLVLTLLQWVSGALRQRLSKVGLTGLEVALELWLALTASPQARWLQYGTASAATAMLQVELSQEGERVWRAIVSRQIEAPAEFQAIQTHRAKLALMRQQLAHVKGLAETGAIEEGEEEALLERLEERLRELESHGPSWKAASVAETLRNVPFMAGLSEGTLDWVRAYGELRTYQAGQCIIPPMAKAAPPGVFVVVSGLCRAEVVRGGRVESHYIGSGGQMGLVTSVVGGPVKGMQLVAAYAQGSALGRGPVLLHLPPRLLAMVEAKAAAGLPEFLQLQVNLHRQAAVFVFDRLNRSGLQPMADLVEHLTHLFQSHAHATARSDRRLRHQLEALLGSKVMAQVQGAFLDEEGFTGGGDGGHSACAALLDNEEALGAVLAERSNLAAEAIRDALRLADVVRLAPGEELTQTSSILVLDGSLSVPSAALAPTAATTTAPAPNGGGGGDAPAPPRGDAAAPRLRSVAAPALLAWAPELFEALASRFDTNAAVALTGGPRGATLLVCPVDNVSGGSESGASDAGGDGGGGGGGDDGDAPPPLRAVRRLTSLKPLAVPDAGVGG